MKKRVSLIAISLLLIFFGTKLLSDFNVFSISKSYTIAQKPHFQCEIQPKTSFKLKLAKGCTAPIGRENWKKGEDIQIAVKSFENYSDNLEIGILEAEDMSKGWGYNDYGRYVPLTANDEGIFEYKIPKDGEYGILIRDKSKQKNIAEYDLFYNKEKLVVENNMTESIGNLHNTKTQDFYEAGYVIVEFDVNQTIQNPLIK